jgi:hypothetical protein
MEKWKNSVKGTVLISKRRKWKDEQQYKQKGWESNIRKRRERDKDMKSKWKD